MRPGLFPSQERALRRAFKKADKFDHFRRRTRRTFLGLGLLAVVGTSLGAASGFWLGRRRAVDPWAARIVLAHKIAAAAEDVLLRDHVPFLMVLEHTGGDDVLWLGFERLARLVLSSTAPEHRELARRLRLTFDVTAPPPEVLLLRPLLEARAR
jgi:hypothetical protein